MLFGTFGGGGRTENEFPQIEIGWHNRFTAHGNPFYNLVYLMNAKIISLFKI